MNGVGSLSGPGLVALVLTLAFAALAVARPRRAVPAYAVLGAAPPALQLGAFSGRSITQGLLRAEILATLLVGVWLVNRDTRHRLLRQPFDLPLVLMAVSAGLSLVATELMPDPGVVGQVTLAVSVGQLLLILWPIGVYLASRELITSTTQIVWLQRLTIGLALPQLVMPFVGDAARDFMAWVWTFGLFASPLALAASFTTRSWPAKLGLLTLTVVPLVRGITSGKVFLYGFVIASVVTILWARATRVAVALGVVLLAGLLAATVVVGPSALLEPVAALVDVERRQASFEGDAGRGQLILDALSIWQEAPVLGVGPGNSYVYMLQRSPIGTPHNQYMNILVEFGLVGLVIWIWCLVATFVTGLRLYRRLTHPAHRTFALGWLGAFVGMAAGGVTGDYMLHSIRNGGLELFQGYYLQWVLLGALVAAGDLEGRAALPEPVRRPARRWAGRPRFRSAAGRALSAQA